MGESFVDVSYRGLELGRRLKLRDVRSETGYLEIPLPMPVGTKVELVVDDGMKLEAVVTAVHEQVAGSDQPPGMRVRPMLAGAVEAWWKGRVDAAAEAKEKAAAATGRATMVMSTEAVQAALAAADAAEGLEDDGRRTDVIAVVTEEVLEAAVTAGGRTTVMDAIDISMITGEAPPDVGAASGDDDDAEISVESSGEISGELEITPSGKVTTNGNGKSKGRSSRSKRKKR